MIRILVFGMSTHMGGVETYIMNLYRNINRKEIQFDFVVSGESCYYSEEINSLGGEIYYVTPKRKNVLANSLDLLKILTTCKRTHKVIYFNLSALYYNVPFYISKLVGFPLIISHAHNTRGSTTKKDLRYLLHCVNRKYVSKKSNFLFACSKSAGEWVLGKNKVKEGRVSIIPNAIETSEYLYSEDTRNNIRKELNIKKDQFVIGNVGRFSYQKNQVFLLEIFEKIILKNPKTILLLVGDGELRPEIERKITELNISDKVILTGTRSDVPKLLQAMDLFVLPSNFEGLPFVLIEAQASGLTCVTSKNVVTKDSDITGLVEFIELKRKPDYWADQILKYYNNKKRLNMSWKIKESGYDITEQSLIFEKFINEANLSSK